MAETVLPFLTKQYTTDIDTHPLNRSPLHPAVSGSFFNIIQRKSIQTNTAGLYTHPLIQSPLNMALITSLIELESFKEGLYKQICLLPIHIL